MMILLEDMKIGNHRASPSFGWELPREITERRTRRNPKEGNMINEDQVNRIAERIIGLRSRFIGRSDPDCSNRPITRASPTN
jgi:hypothetical protein